MAASCRICYSISAQIKQQAKPIPIRHRRNADDECDMLRRHSSNRMKKGNLAEIIERVTKRGAVSPVVGRTLCTPAARVRFPG